MLGAALIFVAFGKHYHSARENETIRLTADKLTVVCVNAKGRVRRWRFQPYWLKVDIEDRQFQDSGPVLTSHGKSLVIGSF